MHCPNSLQRSQNQLARFLKRIENWFTCHKLTEVFLILVTLLFMLKTSANLVAVLNRSRSLIVDYNGALLLSVHFEWCFILINFALFSSSTMCLMALLFTLSLESKLKLIKYYAISQLVLASLILVLMAKLWFAPFKLKLNEAAWQESITNYDYKFELDSGGLLPSGGDGRNSGATWRLWWPMGVFEGAESDSNSNLESVGFLRQYKYSNTVDRLQQSLGCCGLSGPEDWFQNRLALLPPSCCPNPVGLSSLSMSSDSSLAKISPETMADIAAAMATSEPVSELESEARGGHHQVFYCQWVVPTSRKQGCQRFLIDRETRFIFNLRLSLLFLLTILISVTLASLSYYTSLLAKSNRQQLQPQTHNHLHNQHQHHCQRLSARRSRQIQRHVVNEAVLVHPAAPTKLDTPTARVSSNSSISLFNDSSINPNDLQLIQAVRSYRQEQSHKQGRRQVIGRPWLSASRVEGDNRRQTNASHLDCRSAWPSSNETVMTII